MDKTEDLRRWLDEEIRRADDLADQAAATSNSRHELTRHNTRHNTRAYTLREVLARVVDWPSLTPPSGGDNPTP